MTQLLSAGRASPGGASRTAAFPVGSWERPDPAGIVCRGAAVGFRGYVEEFGGALKCAVGRRGPSLAPDPCGRPAEMEVYGIPMCAAHGEEAASGVLEEIGFDLEQELQRPMNDHVRPLSPHLERALAHGFGSLPDGANDYERDAAALLEAFPLDRGRASSEILAYVEDPDGEGRAHQEPPHDAYMTDRLIVCRHMRLAFEAGAHWLVDTLEGPREQVAAQAAYALALEREAGLRPDFGGGDDV